jgi:hypothetical protein
MNSCWTLAFLFVMACGCGSGGTTESCHVDGDCQRGQGCKTESGDNYCAPLCSDDSQCPMQKQCAGQTDQPTQECKEVGNHTDGNGVCDVYNGSYGPKTCR